MRDRLAELLGDYAEEPGVAQFGLRDLLTDLRHIAGEAGLQFDTAVSGSEVVYEEEVAEEGG